MPLGALEPFLVAVRQDLIAHKVRDDGRHARVETDHVQHVAVVRVGQGEALVFAAMQYHLEGRSELIQDLPVLDLTPMQNLVLKGGFLLAEIRLIKCWQNLDLRTRLWP